MIASERLAVCPVGLHFARVEGDAKRCTKPHLTGWSFGVPRSESGWTSNTFEGVTHPPTLSAYALGGWDAVMQMWFGERYLRWAPNLAEGSTRREAQLDYLLLTGRIPSRFRLTDGSADGWIRRADHTWDRVFFPPLRWDKVDLEGMLRDITINPV